MEQIKKAYDLIGDIAIMKFDRDVNNKKKKEKARQFLKENKHIKTVLEKADKIKGRLRIAKTKFLSGENKRETIYLENQCKFKLNVDETYFSPRMANQRLYVAEEILRKVGKNDKILVMFAGVAPFSIVIARKLKMGGKNNLVVSNEINKKASKYAEENVKLNKLDNVKIIQCDAKKLPGKLKGKSDFIVMPRPNLKDTFLDVALKLGKKNAKVYYHGFGTKEKVLQEIGKYKNKITKVKMKKAGEIAPYQNRWMVEFSIK